MKSPPATNNETKSFPLSPLICLVSGLATSPIHKPITEVVGFMAGIKLEIMESQFGLMMLQELSPACAKSLVEQHSVLGELAKEFKIFCQTNSMTYRKIHTWMEIKKSRLPLELQSGFPIKKLEQTSTPSPVQSQPERTETHGDTGKRPRPGGLEYLA